MAQLRQVMSTPPFRHQRQAEPARIVIAQLGAVVEVDDDMIVLPPRRVGATQISLPDMPR